MWTVTNLLSGNDITVSLLPPVGPGGWPWQQPPTTTGRMKNKHGSYMVNDSPRCHTNSLCWSYLHLRLLCHSWMMRTPSFLTSCRRLWSTCSTEGRSWPVKREISPVVSQHMRCIFFPVPAIKNIRAFLEKWLHLNPKLWQFSSCILPIFIPHKHTEDV